MEFRDLVISSKTELKKPAAGEARFSFLQGGYVEDQDINGSFLLPLLLI